MTRFLGLVLFTALAPLHYGCSADDMDREQGLFVDKEQVVAELALDGHTVRFVEWIAEGDSTLVLTAGGTNSEMSPVDLLQQATGPLTMLELFTALAPSQIPPLAITEAHLAQASSLGRADERILSFNKDDLLIAKQAANPGPGQSPCDNALFFPPPIIWHFLTGSTLNGGNAYLCSGTGTVVGGAGQSIPTASSCTEYFQTRQRAGVCKASAGSSFVSNAGYGVMGGGWFSTPNITVAPNQYYWWEFVPSSTFRRLAAVGISATGNNFGLKAGQGG